ncbi:O-methyltransferase [Ramaria rubella]|nr:O-methyltransferase [Ramaria rubella]
MTIQNLRLLRTVLCDSLDALEKLYLSKSQDLPSLDDPYVNDEAEVLASDPEAIQAVNETVSAAYQIISTVRHPFETLSDASSAYNLSACLRVAEKYNVVEILREAGPEGCHIDIISKQTGLHSNKLGLARVLRVLATHHIFREVYPNHFANNRVSSYFDTGKSSRAIIANPKDKYTGTSGAAAYIGTFTDDVFKASSYLLEALEDPETGNKFLASNAALQKAFSTDKVYFSWLEGPSNEYRFERYGACIRGTSLWDAPEAILKGFDWDSLDACDLIVDVGGGTGAPAMLLAQGHPELRIVIQDRKPVVAQGTQYWEDVFPEALRTGRVSFEVHDFFEPQPQRTTSVFLVRTICHDWPDDLAIRILLNLRKASNKSTKLILADFVIPYACPNDSADRMVPGAAMKAVKAPLLANLGKATANAYWIDMTMQVLLNGQERTLPHHIDILAQAGWRVISVFRAQNSQFGYLTAVPTAITGENHSG